MRRVVVTGLGAVTPLGVGVESTWSRLLAGHSGIVKLPDDDNPRWNGVTSRVVGLVPRAAAAAAVVSASTSACPAALATTTTTTSNTRATSPISLLSPSRGWNPHDWLQPDRSQSQFTQYAIAAVTQALQQARWTPTTRAAQEATGVCIGSGIGNLEELYETSVQHAGGGGYRRVSPLFVPRILINMAAAHVSMRWGFRGPNHSVSTACTTGAHSIGDAARFVRDGDADVMVAAAAESCVHPLAFAGFGRARSLATNFNHDPAAACRPFDARRSGFVLAEGAAAVVLEELQHARERGAHILAEFRGYGYCGDAHHMTAPREDGSGALMAMRLALRRAGLRPADIDYVNAHATGTRIGDLAEAKAINELMLDAGGSGTRDGPCVVSSTKGAIGHLLGAAGAIEAIFSILAVAENKVPPTLNLDSPDVGVDLDFVPKQMRNMLVRAALSNSFGFGGTNSSLVFSKYISE